MVQWFFQAGNFWRPFDAYNNACVERWWYMGEQGIVQIEGHRGVVNTLNLTMMLNGDLLVIYRQ